MPKTKKQIAESKMAKRYELEAVYGLDNKPEGTVIAFFKLYKAEGEEFTYIAHKISEYDWYVGGKYMNWGDLLFELDRDNLYIHDPSLIKVAPAMDTWETLDVTPPF